MNCPNCGKVIRSKKSCAFCGAQFDGKNNHPHKHSKKIEEVPVDDLVVMSDEFEVDHLEPTSDHESTNILFDEVEDNHTDGVVAGNIFDKVDDYDDIMPATKRKKRGCLSVIIGLIQLAIVLLLVFLAFFFGPKYFNQAMDYFKGNSRSDNATTVVQETTSEQTTETTQKAVNVDVNVAQFPNVVVTMNLDESMDALSHNSFKLNVSDGENEQAVTEYSVNKKDNTVTIKFVDPFFNVQSSNMQDRTLKLAVNDMMNEVTYQAKEVTSSVENLNTIAELISSELGEQGENSSVVIAKGDEKPILVTNSKQMNAAQTIEFFVLQRVYEAIDQHTVTLEDTVSITDSIKATNDTGEMSQLAEGTSVTIKQLVDAVISRNDLTAANHLIQETGGVNEFNIWLDTQDYIATLIEEKIGFDEAGNVTGAKTSAYDVALLLSRLANNDLISDTTDAELKTALLNTPVTTKFPEGLTAVRKRYEIPSDNDRGTAQHYAGLIETDTENYVVVVFSQDTEDVAARNVAISNIVKGIFDNGFKLENPVEETVVETTTIETTVFIETTQAYNPIHDPNVQPAETWDNFDDDGDGVNETYRAGRWYFDYNDNTWKYY